MKKLLLLSSLFVIAALLTACGGTPKELLDTQWQWTQLTETEPAAQSVVADPENYVLVFNTDGTFTAQVDCNLVSGSYEVSGDKLTVMPGPSTMAECGPESLYDLFLGFFGQVSAYELDGDTLTLIVGDDTAMMFFESAGPAE